MQQKLNPDFYRKNRRHALTVERSSVQQLRVLMKQNGFIFTAWMFLHLGIWALATWTVFMTDNMLFHVICTLLLGNQLHAITVLQHECGHNTAYRSRATNVWIGRFLSWFIFMPFTTFTECHRRHHQYVGDPQRDPDEWNYAGGIRWMAFRLALFVPNFIGMSLVRYGSKIRRIVLGELFFNSVSIFLVFYLFLSYGCLYEFGIIFGFPMLLLAIVINPISRGYEHLPLATMPQNDINRFDLAKNTITVTSKVFGFLWANITYHVEHHIYPTVPFYHLPKLARLLSDKEYLRDRLPLERLFTDAPPLIINRKSQGISTH